MSEWAKRWKTSVQNKLVRSNITVKRNMETPYNIREGRPWQKGFLPLSFFIFFIIPITHIRNRCQVALGLRSLHVIKPHTSLHIAKNKSTQLSTKAYNYRLFCKNISCSGISDYHKGYTIIFLQNIFYHLLQGKLC